MQIKKMKYLSLSKLILVIAILGMLSAFVIPRFFNINNQAQLEAIQDVADALSSSNAENYALRVIKSTNGKAVANCIDIASINQGGLANGYFITPATVPVNVTTTCTLTGPGKVTALFNATGIN